MCFNVLQFHWYTWLRPLAMRISAVLSLGMSLLVLVIEFTMLFGTSSIGRAIPDLVRQQRSETGNSEAFQFLFFIPCLYMTYAVLFCLFKIQVLKVNLHHFSNDSFFFLHSLTFFSLAGVGITNRSMKCFITDKQMHHLLS
jgi:NADH:ubiquinone oxidoreductase subunit 3 (subunit A)